MKRRDRSLKGGVPARPFPSIAGLIGPRGRFGGRQRCRDLKELQRSRGLSRYRREHDDEGRSLAFLALDIDGSSMSLDDLSHDPKTESDPLPRVCQPGEGLEDSFAILGADTDTAVFHDQTSAAATSGDLDANRTRSAELDGVGDQVRQQFVDADRIPNAMHGAPQSKVRGRGWLCSFSRNRSQTSRARSPRSKHCGWRTNAPCDSRVLSKSCSTSRVNRSSDLMPL